MNDVLLLGHHGSSFIDVLLQVATLAAGLLIAVALRFGIESLGRKRAARRQHRS